MISTRGKSNKNPSTGVQFNNKKHANMDICLILTAFYYNR